MSAYQANAVPFHSTIASFIPLLVGAWFLVAAGAILADPVSPYTQRGALASAAAAPAGPAHLAECATPRHG